MNNTEKLLRAFIEAQGFDIETIETFNEAAYLVKKADYKNNPEDYRGAFCKSPPFRPSFTEIDYKVTKREELPLDCVVPCVPLPIDSEAWGCVVNFIISHRNDVVSSVNDFGELAPMLNFMERS